ncbi:hypothetical protein KXR64_23085 [Brucella intermedia]|nr:hypothetical protein [Brucella intermedia]
MSKWKNNSCSALVSIILNTAGILYRWLDLDRPAIGCMSINACAGAGNELDTKNVGSLGIAQISD